MSGYQFRAPRLNAKGESPPPEGEAAIVETPAVLFRRAAVASGFQRMFQELSDAFAHAPAGVWAHVQELAPALAGAIDDTEDYADNMARAYVQGLVELGDFTTALSRHRQAWVRGIEVVTRATPPFPQRQPCSGCGATDCTVVVRDDEGTLHCRQCLEGRSQNCEER